MIRSLLENIELFFRLRIVYPTLKLIFRNPQIVLPIDIARVNSILFLRYDKIGDMIVTIPIFRIIKRFNPRIVVGVVTSESNAEVLKDEPSVDECYILSANLWRIVKLFRKIRQKRYDVVLNFIFNRTTTGGLIANLSSPDAMKIGQGAERYKFYFNSMLSLPRGGDHMLDILIHYVQEVFGIVVGEDDRHLVLEPNAGAAVVVDQFLRASGLFRTSDRDKSSAGYVVVNISAGEQMKGITLSQAEACLRYLADELERPCVVISAPEDCTNRDNLVAGCRSNRIRAYPTTGCAPLNEIVSLIEGAACVITPDTSIVHIASAVKTPVLGFYSPLLVNQEWLPYKVMSASVMATEGNMVSTIPAETLKIELRKFIDLLPIHG
jgi:ADP-heptose:LPS heptosyltransferase